MRSGAIHVRIYAFVSFFIRFASSSFKNISIFTSPIFSVSHYQHQRKTIDILKTLLFKRARWKFSHYGYFNFYI